MLKMATKQVCPWAVAETTHPLHQAVFAQGDAVDLVVKVLDALQQVVEDLLRLPLRLVQSFD